MHTRGAKHRGGGNGRGRGLSGRGGRAGRGRGRAGRGRGRRWMPYYSDHPDVSVCVLCNFMTYTQLFIVL